MKKKLCMILTSISVVLVSVSCPVYAYNDYNYNYNAYGGLTSEYTDLQRKTNAKDSLQSTTSVLAAQAATVAPTTQAATVAPTTQAVTAAPTTQATTVAPTTEATTEATTAATTTESTTEATTAAPITTESTTEATTAAPTTEATTAAPTTEVTTQATTVAPTTQATTVAPTTEATTEATTSITIEYIKANYSEVYDYSIASWIGRRIDLNSYISYNKNASDYKWIIDGDGLYDFISEGNIKVTKRKKFFAYAYNEKDKTYYSFTFRPKSSSDTDEVESISNTITIDIKSNQTKDLSYYVSSDIIPSAYDWEVDDDDICEVSRKGVVKGLDEGDTYIRCTYYDNVRNYNYRFHVYVKSSSRYSNKSSGSTSSKSVTTIKEETTETTTKKKTSSSSSNYTETQIKEETSSIERAFDKFNDISHRPWAVEAIGNMVNKGYIVGVSENSFMPDNNCIRGDFAIVIAKMLGLYDDGNAAGYNDVSETDYFFKYINGLRSAGAEAGVSDNNFRPRDYITREEAFAFCYKGLVSKGMEFNTNEDVLNNYADAGSISNSEYKTAIAALLNAGLITGTTVGIEPNSTITRAQMAVLLNNIDEKI